LNLKKNHALTFEAFNIIRNIHPKIRLLIIGKEGWLCDYEIKTLKSGSMPGVIWKPNISNELLSCYLKQSLALLFPSLVEGWGLPPREALSCGITSIVSKIPACIEACGQSAVYVNDYKNPMSWASTIKQLLEDETRYINKVKEIKPLFLKTTPTASRRKCHCCTIQSNSMCLF